MNECPYRSMGNICTHVGCKTTRKHKSICIYKNENSCPIYQQWIEEKLAEDALNGVLSLSEDYDGSS